MYHDLDYEKILSEARNIISEHREDLIDPSRNDMFEIFNDRIFKPRGIKEEDIPQILEIMCELDKSISTILNRRMIIGHKGKSYGSFLIHCKNNELVTYYA